MRKSQSHQQQVRSRSGPKLVDLQSIRSEISQARSAVVQLNLRCCISRPFESVKNSLLDAMDERKRLMTCTILVKTNIKSTDSPLCRCGRQLESAQQCTQIQRALDPRRAEPS